MLDGSGRLRGVIGSGGDATKICGIGGVCRYYLWVSVEKAVDVTDMLERGRVLRVWTRKGVGVAQVASWTASAPYVHARVVADLDEYARWLARQVGRELRGKTVLLGFSGGKDSVAALLVLLALQEYVPFRLHVMFVHIPFLESPRSIEFVEKIASKLGVEIDVRTAPRRDMKSLLKWKGMPRRGYRYCTVYKAKPMREVRKSDPRVVEVVADRLTESPKRFERLYKAAASHVLLAGRKFRPTYLLTLLDIVHIVRKAGLVHPDYLDGKPRVACSLCPYEALYEFRRIPELEDPGLIEKVLEKMWRKWYSWASYEVFREQHLWRYPAAIARPLLVAKEYAEAASPIELWAEQVEEIYRRVWVGPEPKAPILDNPWKAAELAIRAWKKGLPVAVPEEDRGEA